MLASHTLVLPIVKQVYPSTINTKLAKNKNQTTEVRKCHNRRQDQDAETQKEQDPTPEREELATNFKTTLVHAWPGKSKRKATTMQSYSPDTTSMQTRHRPSPYEKPTPEANNRSKHPKASKLLDV